MKYIIVCLMGVLILACNNSPVNQTQKENSQATTDSLINNPGLITDSANVEGARLIAASDCLTCHKINQKTIGPSYDSIAARYPLTEGNVENLAYKVIHGGKGRWGNQVAMTPHPNLQYTDVEKMVKYILSLRDRH